MTTSDSIQFTDLLRRARNGSTSAIERFWVAAYKLLERPARQQLAADPRIRRVMEPGSLLHEAWMDLNGQMGLPWDNRIHFLRTAAKIMRQIRYDRARKLLRDKHGGGVKHIALYEVEDPAVQEALDTVALHKALRRLERIRRRAAQVVELRFFAGFTVKRTAAALEVTPAVVVHDWVFARAWLHRALEGTRTAA